MVLARFGAAHGARGEVRLKAFTADPAAVADYGPLEAADGRRFAIEALRPAGADMLVVRVGGIADRSAAEALSGIELSVPRSRLPPPGADDFYHADLIGLVATTVDGLPLGTVAAVHNHGAGDIIEIAREGATALLVPFTRATVPVVDIVGGRMTVVPPAETDEPNSAHSRASGNPDEPGTREPGSPRSQGRAGKEDVPQLSVPWSATVLTLVPDIWPGPIGASLVGRALDEELWALEVADIREAATDRHRTVDDTPAGGGPGMVLRADVLATAIDAGSPSGDPRPRWLMSPRGLPLTQAMVRRLAEGPGVLLIAGRFEGVDERIIEARGLVEISIGDYVLSGGDIAAMAVIDAAVRLLPGVLGNAASADSESFSEGLLEYPHYTRPQLFEGRPIPEVLTSGDHGRIAAWRKAEAERLTAGRRPDILRRER